MMSHPLTGLTSSWLESSSRLLRLTMPGALRPDPGAISAAQPRLVVYGVVILALIAATLLSTLQAYPVPQSWLLTADAMAAGLAVACGALGLTFYSSFGARSLLFVSTGFLGAGAIQGVHILLRLLVNPLLAGEEAHLTQAMSTLTSQAYLAIMLLLGWRASEGRISPVSANAIGTRRLVARSLFALALLLVVGTWLPRDPGFGLSGLALRVSEGSVGLLFVATLALFLLRGDWRSYTFQHGFILFLVFAAGSHLALVIGAPQAQDFAQLVAAALKITGFAIAFTTLLVSTSGLLEQVSELRLDTRIRELIDKHALQSPGGELAPALTQHQLHSAGTFELDLATGRFRGNRTTARLVGSPEQGIETVAQFRSLIHPEDTAALEAALRQSQRNGVLFKQQFRLREASGERWIEAVAGVESVAGKPLRLLGFIDDVTQSKLLQLERDRLQSDLEQLLAAIDQHAATATLNRQGTIESVNGLFGDFCDQPVEEIHGRKISSLLQVESGSAPLPVDFAALETDSPWVGEVRFERPDGSVRIAQASITPQRVRGRKAGKLVYVGFDVTARAESQQALLESVRAHRKSNEDLQMFAHIVSHDLQEPLRMVSSFMTLLDRRYTADLAQEAKEFIQYAVEGAQRMRDLLDGLLEYSRVNSQGNAFEVVDLNQPVAGAIANLAVLIGETGAEVSVGKLPALRADQSQMIQLFQNLVANGIKFCPSHRPRILIDAHREEGKPVITISDNGIGINPDHYDRIFQIFQRLNARDEFSGSGVGLAVCKRIMERHGGHIGLESALGQGTTFSLTFGAPS